MLTRKGRVLSCAAYLGVVGSSLYLECDIVRMTGYDK